MTKAALREQRRSQRIAKRNRQRIIIGIIVLLLVAVIAIFVYRDYASKTQSQAGNYPIGTLDSTPPTISASAVTTASGLKYEDLQVGTSTAAKSGDSITVNYTGWLTNGTKFDSSIDRGQTSDFIIGVGNVIAGWDEGIPGMKVGGTRLLVIPPTLGYGSSGSGSIIPPDSTLIFEVQLVAIK